MAGTVLGGGGGEGGGLSVCHSLLVVAPSQLPDWLVRVVCCFRAWPGGGRTSR